MPVHAYASGWKTCKSVWAFAAGAWRRCAGVWVVAGGAWQRIGGNLQSASAGGGGNQQCFYFPPSSGCTAVATFTAYPQGGWQPFSYQWYIVSQSGSPSIGATNGQTLTVSKFGNRFSGGANVTAYCVVTDVTGAQAATNQVSAHLQSEDGNI
ncbi:MAG TPA: hypothetical protein VGD46_05055 [Rhizobacter sp.]